MSDLKITVADADGVVLDETTVSREWFELAKTNGTIAKEIMIGLRIGS